MAIPFTQYLQPNGAKRAVVIDVDEETEAQAKILIDKGYHFDVEILNTGLISLTCEDDEDLISIEICENDASIPNTVRKVIRTAIERINESENEQF